MSQTKDEDIDFLDFFILLWEGKWIITLFMIISGLLGSYLLYNKSVDIKNKGPNYRSEIKYTANSSHTILKKFHESINFNEKLITDFQNLFYKDDIFNEWKKLNIQSELMFEEFSNLKDFDGMKVEKKEGNRLTTFKTKEKDIHYIEIKTKKLIKIKDIYDYSNYVSNVLTLKYKFFATERLDLMLKKLNEYSNDYNLNITYDFIDNVITLERYLVDIQNGERAIEINYPSEPDNLNSAQYDNISFLRIAVYFIIGGMIGIFVTFTRNAFIKRKKLLPQK